MMGFNKYRFEIKLPSTDNITSLFEKCLLCSMFITILIPQNLGSIIPWGELSPLLIFRATSWLLGLSILPGLFLLRMVELGEDLSHFEKVAITVNLSLVLVGLVALLLYYACGSITLLPWIFLVGLTLAVSICWLKSKTKISTEWSICKWDLVLIVGVTISIFIAFSIQVSQRYLIPGDLWVSLKAAVQILSRPDLYKSWDQNYPLMFGFILAGLSVSSGVPILNTYVLLFPLIGLNMLSFYALLREVFGLDKKIAVSACIIYGFTGGFGWLLQNFLNKGILDFWTVSYLTQDIYFNEFFWHNIEFSYKSLALTLGYMSIVMFTVSTRLKDTYKKSITITLTSLLTLFSFFIHMIESIILVPVILCISLVYQKGRDRYKSLVLLASITILLFCVLDFFMSGYYYWLTGDKIRNVLLVQIDVEKIVFYSFLLIGLIVITVIIRRYIYLDILGGNRPKKPLRIIKILMIITLTIIYLSGLYFWLNAPPSHVPIYLLNAFPWYYYTTRFGFAGLLALIGLGITNWQEKWFRIAIFWALLVLLAGDFWWGSKMTCYLFPIVALFAAIGLNSIWSNANISLRLTLTTPTNPTGKEFKLSLKPMTTALVIVIMILATSSTIYGINYYFSKGPCMGDDEARAFAWIQQNVPKNATVLVPEIYTTKLGVITIADRQIFQYRNLSSSLSTESLIQTFTSLKVNNVSYVVVVEGYDEPTELLECLLWSSTLAYHSNDVKVYKLPPFSPPSEEYAVAVVDREFLGFFGNSSVVGWLDDDFATGWLYRNVNVTLDGEIITFERSFKGEESPVPSASKDVPLIDTNLYPYILVRYRNTPKTDIGVTQVITLRNETGWYGVITNVYLDYSKLEMRTITAKLPPNQKVANINIWARNHNHLNGTFGLQVDYIAFVSGENLSQFNLASKLRYLSIAIPATWDIKYKVFSSFDECLNSSIIISSYDKSIINYVKLPPRNVKFILFNASVTIPPWGEKWAYHGKDIIFGLSEEKEILIVKIPEEGNIIDLSTELYKLVDKKVP